MQCLFQEKYYNLADKQEEEYQNPTDLQREGRSAYDTIMCLVFIVRPQ